jgi:hypothetical protein
LQKGIEFLQKPITFPEKTIAFPEKTITFLEKAMRLARRRWRDQIIDVTPGAPSRERQWQVLLFLFALKNPSPYLDVKQHVRCLVKGFITVVVAIPAHRTHCLSCCHRTGRSLMNAMPTGY